MSIEKIRNFCIIAHIDHGKSTLADRFLETTMTLSKRDMKHAQMLDTMDLEQERGITIKLQPVRMQYKGYTLNLIDTPGHADFAYEVSRSLAAVDGAILVVDATQGIQAQTLANLYQATEHGLTIVPVINKIDLPASNVPKVLQELEDVLAIPREDVIAVSAKTGENIEAVLDAIIERVKAPSGDPKLPTRALIFDSLYDDYRGVVAYVRVVDGTLSGKSKVRFHGTSAVAELLEVGSFSPKYVKEPALGTGQIGYVVTNLKTVHEARVGDTIMLEGEKSAPLPGYKKVMPMVFASIFCVNNEDFKDLREAIEKLSLNDAALTYEPESSTSLGFGFRCGFLGLLHMDIIKERLEREYHLELITTSPSVPYEIGMTDGSTELLSHPAMLPNPTVIREIREPWVKLDVFTPSEYLGSILQIVTDERGIFKNTVYLDEQRVRLLAELPLASLVSDFYDRIKSASQGYASMNYELLEFRAGDLVKLAIHVAGDDVPSLSQIVARRDAFYAGNALLKRLKDLIPRAQFQIALQAVINGKVIARENISAMRKDVIGYLYGGDRTRKDKLLKKQKEGKKRMKAVGKVNIPQEAFMALLKKG